MSEKPYYWMTRATTQREWIERRGLLLWLAFFFIELGAGLYLASLIFDNLAGLFIGWLICLVIGGGFHLVFLGRPQRFWRAVLKPQTSWISRGLIFVILFAVLGAVHLVLSYLLPDANLLGLRLIMGVISFVVIIYGGFVFSYTSAIPLWNSGLIPTLFVIAGFLGGLGLLLGGYAVAGAHPEDVESWARIMLLAFVMVLCLYLVTARYASNIGSQSIYRILRGDLATVFYPFGAAIGIIFPLAVAVYGLVNGLASMPAAILFSAIICSLIGDLAIRYCILKAALYTPLLPVAASK